MGKSWSVVETKAKLSEVLKRAALEPQVIENRGEPVAVILSFAEYSVLKASAAGAAPKHDTPVQRFLKASERLRLETGGIELELPSRADRPSPAFEEP